MSKPKVFLSREMLPECLERLQSESELEYNPDDRSLTEKEIIAGVKGKDALIVMAADPVGPAIMDANPELKIIANFGVGYDRLDVAAATARGIPITNTPDVVTEATADMAWALLMAAGRRIAEGDRFIRARRWVTTSPRLFLGLDIAGATLGLLGLGRIGKAMIPRAKGFGMTINYWNRTRLPESEEKRLGIQYVEKETLFSEADFVSIHVALNPDTVHLVGEAELALMKPTAYLINTTRGPVVDEKALVAVLMDNKIAGAGLDVFENEPKLEPELYELENAVLVPHIGSATVGTRTNIGMMVIDNCLAGCRGERPPNVVNPEIYD
jgi:glyoxylate reductase